MNRSILIKETIRLAESVERALVATGCIHRLKDSVGARSVPVPLEKTRYDPETGMLWVEINAERLPHGFSLSRLQAVGLPEKVMELYRRRVVLIQITKSIIVASWIELPSGPALA
mgnify:CR=1 FL=1